MSGTADTSGSGNTLTLVASPMLSSTEVTSLYGGGNGAR
jgi:hypothetical protein